jgi:hypothetical protein
MGWYLSKLFFTLYPAATSSSACGFDYIFFFKFSQNPPYGFVISIGEFFPNFTYGEILWEVNKNCLSYIIIHATSKVGIWLIFCSLFCCLIRQYIPFMRLNSLKKPNSPLISQFSITCKNNVSSGMEGGIIKFN